MNCENWWLCYTSSSIFSTYSIIQLNIQYINYSTNSIIYFFGSGWNLSAMFQMTFVYFLQRLGEGVIICILDGCITEVWCSIGWITRAKILQVTCEIKLIVCQSLLNHAFNMIYWVVLFQWPIFPQFRQLDNFPTENFRREGFVATDQLGF